VRDGPLSLTAPAAWRTVDAPAVPGLAFLSRPVALRVPDGGGTVMAGVVDGRGRTLLPAALLDRLPDAPRATPVKLPHVEAYRYARLRPEGAAEPVSELYASPTSRGVAVVGCSGAHCRAARTPPWPPACRSPTA
jgi:hypothetical protein